jgi:hypothetical protein
MYVIEVITLSGNKPVWSYFAPAFGTVIFASE